MTCVPKLLARRVGVRQLVLLPAFIASIGAAMLTAQTPDAPPTLTVSIKGSPVYAQPTSVPIKTAVLVITPNWEGLNATTPTGGREASGQPLYVSDVVVVLSNIEMDCAAVFKATAPTPQDIVIAAGRTEAYRPIAGWPSTPLGKLLSDSSATSRKIPIDRFSLDAQFTAQKAKKVSKDGLRGGDGRLILEQDGANWVADFMVKADELVAEGRIPVKSCGITSRSLAELTPLLQERRLRTSADKWGM